MSQSLRSGSEDKLISISKQYHEAIASRDANGLEALLSDSATLYSDGITFQKDIKGSKDVKAYFQAFFDKYDFQRGPSFGAVDENHSMAFSIVTDKGVAPKQGNRDQPSSVISLTKLTIDGHGKITELYIARQLPYDEAQAKLKKVPDYHSTSFNAENVNNDEIKPTAENAKKHEEYASAWNKIFSTNDVSKAEEICDPNIKVHNLLVSDETVGLDAWKDSLKNIFKDWECTNNDHQIAVTPGNKAFVFWKTTGEYKGTSTTVWGITFLLFNEAGKISESAAIYQPFPGMREALLKSP
jgi:ketosteroid isomerase-like protein